MIHFVIIVNIFYYCSLQLHLTYTMLIIFAIERMHNFPPYLS